MARRGSKAPVAPVARPSMRLVAVFAFTAAAVLLVASMGARGPVAWLDAQGIPGLSEGALVRTEGNPKVYLVEDGRKRWFVSEGAFLGQGFGWHEVSVVNPIVLAAHPEGAPIMEYATVVLPGERGNLPDLSPFPAEEMRLDTVGGRLVLRFTTAFWNHGRTPLSLQAELPTVAGDGEEEAVRSLQLVTAADGTSREKTVGTFIWHEPHQHYHYEQFADYTLELVKPAPGASADSRVAVTKKTTFCLRDDRLVDATLPGSPAAAAFVRCGKVRQGVSVGWADVYRYTLPDQFIDVHDMPPGVYRLSFHIDPLARFVEESQADNQSSVLLELDPGARTLRVLAAGAPFETAQNQFPDGLLLKRTGEPGVYVMRAGFKRLVRSEAVFESYGYDWNGIFEFPNGVIDAIPYDRLVRLEGADAVYLTNEAGYRRRLLNPAAVTSYGSGPAAVAVLNATEFATLRETDLVKRPGDDRVFSTTAKNAVGTIDALPAGYRREAVQVVSDADFDAYAVETVASGLDVPWDIAFLPDGDLLVTERPGVLRRLGTRPATMPIPGVREVGEGGLMGIALHPNFAANGLLYLYFTAQDGGQTNRVVRYRLSEDVLAFDRVILDGIPSAIYHDGGRIRFGPDGLLYLTTGDANNAALAQDRSSLAGKTLRITEGGGIPADNPFGNAVWSYGHRNSQGIAWDAAGRLWETEHGRSGALSGFDELNRVEKGKNYGWPAIQGGQTREGMEPPVIHSGAVTTWAPSGLAHLNGRLYFAGLRGAALYSATVQADGRATDLGTHLQDRFGRLRAVVAGPDGRLYVTTSNRDGRGAVNPGDDKILRVHPDFLR